MKKILVFGNPYVKEDNIAVKAANKLRKDEKIKKKFKFIFCSSPDEISEHKDFIILDTAKGIKKIQVIKNINKLESNNIISLHDYDLNFFINLMKSMNKIKKVNIVAVPYNYSEKKACEELKILFNKLV